jgi:hypothetical protein
MTLRTFPLPTDTFMTVLAAMECVTVDASVSAGIGAA